MAADEGAVKPETKLRIRRGVNRAIDIVLIGTFIYGAAGLALMIKRAL